MRVCIPCMDPGGPGGIAAASFEEAEVFDFYDMQPDSTFDLIAQTRPCACWGPDQAEAISRRGIEAIIVGGISPNALLKFLAAGVKVLRADNPSITELLDACAEARLGQIGINEFARSRKNR